MALLSTWHGVFETSLSRRGHSYLCLARQASSSRRKSLSNKQSQGSDRQESHSRGLSSPLRVMSWLGRLTVPEVSQQYCLGAERVGVLPPGARESFHQR